MAGVGVQVIGVASGCVEELLEHCYGVFFGVLLRMQWDGLFAISLG